MALNKRACTSDNFWCRTVILKKLNLFNFRKIHLQRLKAGRIRSAETINCLVGVTNYKKVSASLMPFFNKLILYRIDVLKLIYQ